MSDFYYDKNAELIFTDATGREIKVTCTDDLNEDEAYLVSPSGTITLYGLGESAEVVQKKCDQFKEGWNEKVSIRNKFGVTTFTEGDYLSMYKTLSLLSNFDERVICKVEKIDYVNDKAMFRFVHKGVVTNTTFTLTCEEIRKMAVINRLDPQEWEEEKKPLPQVFCQGDYIE